MTPRKLFGWAHAKPNFLWHFLCDHAAWIHTTTLHFHIVPQHTPGLYPYPVFWDFPSLRSDTSTTSLVQNMFCLANRIFLPSLARHSETRYIWFPAFHASSQALLFHCLRGERERQRAIVRRRKCTRGVAAWQGAPQGTACRWGTSFQAGHPPRRGAARPPAWVCTTVRSRTAWRWLIKKRNTQTPSKNHTDIIQTLKKSKKICSPLFLSSLPLCSCLQWFSSVPLFLLFLCSFSFFCFFLFLCSAFFPLCSFFCLVSLTCSVSFLYSVSFPCSVFCSVPVLCSAPILYSVLPLACPFPLPCSFPALLLSQFPPFFIQPSSKHQVPRKNHPSIIQVSPHPSRCVFATNTLQHRQPDQMRSSNHNMSPHSWENNVAALQNPDFPSQHPVKPFGKD